MCFDIKDTVHVLFKKETDKTVNRSLNERDYFSVFENVFYKAQMSLAQS